MSTLCKDRRHRTGLYSRQMPSVISAITPSMCTIVSRSSSVMSPHVSEALAKIGEQLTDCATKPCWKYVVGIFSDALQT